MNFYVAVQIFLPITFMLQKIILITSPNILQNKDIVVVKGDKDSGVVLIKKSDYVTKLDTMVDDSIMKGTYVATTDKTLKQLSQFQDFLYRNRHNYQCYKDLQPDSNQPARLYGTAKTRNFETLEDISVANLKFGPTIDQTGAFTYNAQKLCWII